MAFDYEDYLKNKETLPEDDDLIQTISQMPGRGVEEEIQNKMNYLYTLTPGIYNQNEESLRSDAENQLLNEKYTKSQQDLKNENLKQWLNENKNKQALEYNAKASLVGMPLREIPKTLNTSFDEINQNTESPETQPREESPAMISGGDLGIPGLISKYTRSLDKRLAEEDVRSKESPMELKGDTIGTSENLMLAHEAENKARLVNQLGKSAEMIGSGLGAAFSGGKLGVAPTPGQKLFDENIQNINFVKSLMMRADMEKNDPSSPISQSYQKILHKLVPTTMTSNLSANQIEKALPLIKEQVGEKRRATEDISKNVDALARMYMVQQMKQQGFDRREHETQLKAAQKWNQDMIPEMKSGRAMQYALDSKTIAGIQNIRAIIDRNQNLNDIPPNVMAEIVRVFDRVMSQSVGAATTFKAILPVTARGDIARLQTYLTGEVVGAQQGKLVNLFKEMLNTEEKQAVGRIKIAQKKLTGGIPHLVNSKYPEVRQIIENGLKNADLSLNISPDDVIKKVVIRKKATGEVKKVPEELANKFLTSPDFEKIQ